MPESRGGDISRDRPVGGRSDRAGLPGCADAWRTTAALGPVARSRGRAPHSRPAPASRPHRWRTPSGTPRRGSAACATAWRGRSRRPAATRAQRKEARWGNGGDRPIDGGGRRRRAARWAAITRTLIPPPARSHARETIGTNGCRCETLGAGARARARQPVRRVGPRADRRRAPGRPTTAPPAPQSPAASTASGCSSERPPCPARGTPRPGASPASVPARRLPARTPKGSCTSTDVLESLMSVFSAGGSLHSSRTTVRHQAR